MYVRCKLVITIVRQDSENHTHEQIVRVRDIAPNAKEFHQVVKLAMYVTAYLTQYQRLALSSDVLKSGLAYCYGCANCDDIALLYQQLSRLVANLADLGLWYRTACSKLRDGSMKS